MAPCLQFPKEMISENVLESGVAQAWKTIHEKTVALRAPAECLNCGIRDECVWCPIKHGHAALSDRCDPAMCELEKRMNSRWRERKEKE